MSRPVLSFQEKAALSMSSIPNTFFLFAEGPPPHCLPFSPRSRSTSKAIHKEQRLLLNWIKKSTYLAHAGVKYDRNKWDGRGKRREWVRGEYTVSRGEKNGVLR